MAERKAFNFYKSYYDVACELSDKDRLLFYDALIKRQFFGIEPDLKGMAKFAYISQKHNVDSQILGWEFKMKDKLQLPDNQTSVVPCQGGCQGGCQQEEEEGEEKEKVEEQYNVFSFDEFWKLYPTKTGKEESKKKYEKLSLKDREKIFDTLKAFVDYKPFPTYNHPMAATYINQKRWNDEIPNSKANTETTKTMVKYSRNGQLRIDNEEKYAYEMKHNPELIQFIEYVRN